MRCYVEVEIKLNKSMDIPYSRGDFVGIRYALMKTREINASHGRQHHETSLIWHEATSSWPEYVRRTDGHKLALNTTLA